MPSLESNVSSKIFYASIRSHIRFIPRITADLINMMKCYCTKMKFPVKDFFSKYDQIRSFLLIWPHLLKKSLMENFIFCVVLLRFLDNQTIDLSSAKSKHLALNYLINYYPVFDIVTIVNMI